MARPGPRAGEPMVAEPLPCPLEPAWFVAMLEAAAEAGVEAGAEAPAPVTP